MKPTYNYSSIAKKALFIQRAMIFLTCMGLLASLMTIFGLINQYDFRLIAIVILLIFMYLQNWERNLWLWLVVQYEEQQQQQDIEYDELIDLCHKINTPSL